ncbi:cupin domain-containing protein [Ramlibacter sp. MMS24-I3-19]|uniref:cupin domain-containing protein n=1 Tax=Ramlibacter sp. MMS24-I3-19 TaxID=3416606 RepID=UPI003D00F028
MKVSRAIPWVLFIAVSTCWAQATGVTARPLLRTTVSGDESKESVIAAIEFAPGATTGLHTHPGDEYAVVTEGALELRPQGQPVRRVSAGQAYHNARGLVHETVNVGTTPAKTVATFVLDRGKPLTEPVH